MYSDAVKTSGSEGKIIVKDIIELVVEAMPLEKSATADILTQSKEMATT
jgi:hypothetical protein